MANIKKNELSDIQLKALKRPETKQWIRDGNGLALCITPSRNSDWRQWYFIYTSPETKGRRYYPIGVYPNLTLAKARAEAILLQAEVKRGVDPLERERRSTEAQLEDDRLKRIAEEEQARIITMSELCDKYMNEYAKEFKKSWIHDQRFLDVEIKPVWGKRKAHDVTKSDITTLLNKIKKRGSPVSANGVFKLLRKLFNWSCEQDILQVSPCSHIKMPSPIIQRERVLKADEIKIFWDALNDKNVSMKSEIRQMLKLILITAQRPGEVSGIHTSELEGSWWIIPVERSKNKKAHRVYLSGLARTIIADAIERVKADRGIPADTEYSGFIFPCPHRSKDKPIERNALSRALQRNESPDGKTFGLNDVRPHDLRRTAATMMSALKFSDEIIDAVLNHPKKGIIAVYNKNSYDAEKQQALEAWERKLLHIIDNTNTSKVIPFMRKAA